MYCSFAKKEIYFGDDANKSANFILILEDPRDFTFGKEIWRIRFILK